jgi:hypothetical protein
MFTTPEIDSYEALCQKCCPCYIKKRALYSILTYKISASHGQNKIKT